MESRKARLIVVDVEDMTSRIVGIALAVLLTAGLLGGCSAHDLDVSSGPASSPVNTATAPTSPALVVGAVLTVGQPADLAMGQSAFTMKDGTLVVVQADTSLPDAVKADIAAPVATEFTGSISIAPTNIVNRLLEAQSRVAATGRHAILVFRVMSLRVPAWQASGGAMNRSDGKKTAGYASEADATAAAVAYIATQADPTNWDLIDAAP